MRSLLRPSPLYLSHTCLPRPPWPRPRPPSLGTPGTSMLSGVLPHRGDNTLQALPLHHPSLGAV
jgi:hypothetical protein